MIWLLCVLVSVAHNLVLLTTSGYFYAVAVFKELTVQKLDVLQKGPVYELPAGWLKNRTPGEFINCGFFY